MALERLYNPNTRWLVVQPEAIADFTKPTSKELNDALENGLAVNITCAVNQDGSNFDLGDSDTDDSLTFCQIAGAANPTSYNPEATIEVETDRDRMANSVANKAHDLLAYKGHEYFFLLSVGETPDSPFAKGERIKLFRGATDYGVYQAGSGENIRLSSAIANRGDVNWNYELAA